MKTLDEVINELHYWDTCDGFPESFYDFEVTRDALHYLKEYKEGGTRIMDGFIELHQNGNRKLINTKVIIAVIDIADDRYKSAILIQGSTIPRGFDETYDEIKSLMESMPLTTRLIEVLREVRGEE